MRTIQSKKNAGSTPAKVKQSTQVLKASDKSKTISKKSSKPASMNKASPAKVIKKVATSNKSTPDKKFKKKEEIVEIAESVNLITPKKSATTEVKKKVSKSKSPAVSRRNSADKEAKVKKTPMKAGKGKKQAAEAMSTDEDEAGDKAKNLMPVIKPKRVTGAYLFFVCEFMKSEKVKDIKLTEKVVKAAAEWKLMTDAQKKKFQDMNAKDKVRLDKETKQFEKNGWFINSEGVKSTDIKPELKQFSKDTVMPKKAQRTYSLFMKEKYADIAKAHPGKKMIELIKFIAEEFEKLTPSELQKYEDLRAKDVIRYEQEVEQLRTQGFFVNSDGIKSCDLRKKRTRADMLKIKELKDAEKAKAKLAREKLILQNKKLREKEVADKKKMQLKLQNEKEKARRDKTKQVELKSREKAKAQKDKENDNQEEIGWGHFYRERYENEIAMADGKSEAAKKRVVDAKLSSEWGEFEMKTKRRWIAKAQKASQDDPEFQDTAKPVKNRRRAKPDSAQEEEATVTKKVTNKRQKRS